MSSDLRSALDAFASNLSLVDLKELAEFCRVTQGTSLSWLEGAPLPKGDNLIRLQHFLINRGFPVGEMDDLPAPAYKLGQLIAFDVVSVDDVVRILRYTNTTAVYKVVQGAGLVSDRFELLERLVDDHSEEVQQKIADFKARYAPKRPESLQRSHLSLGVLHVGFDTTLDLLENVLDLIDLDPTAREELKGKVDADKVTMLIDRLVLII